MLIRRLIREAVRGNMNLMDLPGTIEMAVKAYIDSPNCNCRTAQDINNGLCMDFAEYVIDKCGGESDSLFAIDETSFYVDTPEEAEENGFEVGHLIVNRLSSDPNEFEAYTEEW